LAAIQSTPLMPSASACPNGATTIAAGDGSVYLTIEAQSAGQGADRVRSEYGFSLV
jgi:hypothetical protein